MEYLDPSTRDNPHGPQSSAEPSFRTKSETKINSDQKSKSKDGLEFQAPTQTVPAAPETKKLGAGLVRRLRKLKRGNETNN